METIQELAPSEGLQSRPPEPGPKEIQLISEESLNQLEWKETKLAREQDHGMPRAREHSHLSAEPTAPGAKGH